MLRVGLICFGLCLGTVVLATVLDFSHAVVFGPCAGPGALAIYGTLVLTASLGVIFTLLGATVLLVRKIRQSGEPGTY